MNEKEVLNLTKAFEDMYKYYKGWVFAYEHPGVFVYHQMGGPLTVYFTPDWNHRGKVSVQTANEKGEFLSGEEIPYTPPHHNGVPYSVAEAYVLFGIVRPTLEANMDW